MKWHSNIQKLFLWDWTSTNFFIGTVCNYFVFVCKSKQTTESDQKTRLYLLLIFPKYLLSRIDIRKYIFTQMSPCQKSFNRSSFRSARRNFVTSPCQIRWPTNCQIETETPIVAYTSTNSHATLRVWRFISF